MNRASETLANEASRTILVIGGGGGIGSAVSAELAEAGTTVVVCSRSQERGAAALAKLQAEVPAGRFVFRQADISQLQSCHALFDWVAATFGALHGLVNCASPEAPPEGLPDAFTGGIAGPFAKINPELIPAFLQASLGSLFNLCHTALPCLRSAKRSAIVTFASDSGRIAAPNQTMIGSTRAAIIMFTRSLSLELARDGIRVNCVSPSFVADTPVFDRVMRGASASRARSAAERAGLGLPAPQDIAGLTAFLCDDRSSHITGQVISVNGGLSAP